VAKAGRIGMLAKAANERIHGVEGGLAEKTSPQFEVAGPAPRTVNAAACAFPKAAAPIRRFLLNVAQGHTEQKAITRPEHERVGAGDFASFVQGRTATRDPLDPGELREDGSDDGEAAGAELVGGGNPAHDFATGAGEALVEGVVHAVVRLANPAGELR